MSVHLRSITRLKPLPGPAATYTFKQDLLVAWIRVLQWLSDRLGIYYIGY